MADETDEDYFTMRTFIDDDNVVTFRLTIKGHNADLTLASARRFSADLVEAVARVDRLIAEYEEHMKEHLQQQKGTIQ